METIVVEVCKFRHIVVLIVPCGMETDSRLRDTPNTARINCTLRNGNIVPIRYGLQARAVLIVPCGMETLVRSFRINHSAPY